MTLTPAELRVLEAMRTADNDSGQYPTEREAARKLGLSPHTVDAHLRSARRKLGVRTTRQVLDTVFTA